MIPSRAHRPTRTPKTGGERGDRTRTPKTSLRLTSFKAPRTFAQADTTEGHDFLRPLRPRSVMVGLSDATLNKGSR